MNYNIAEKDLPVNSLGSKTTWGGGEEGAAPRLGDRGGMCKVGIAVGSPTRGLGDGGVVKDCRSEDKNETGQEEMLRGDAGPAKASGTSRKVLELDGLSELFRLEVNGRAFMAPRMISHCMWGTHPP